MAIDYNILKNEILEDPLGMGYSTHIESGADLEIANLLNSLDGIGVDRVDFERISKENFLNSIWGLIDNLNNKEEVVQKKWDRYLNSILATGIIDLSSPTIKKIINIAIVDELLTIEEATEIGSRLGSRAEVLFGINTIINHTQVAYALGRGSL